jgi:dTDP-4-dehydrorhamnose 3,5-epimerase
MIDREEAVVMIEGVVLKDLVTHCDERGFFRELIRVTGDFFKEGFGQWSHSLMYQGVIKAWHIHQRQVDWWYVATGVLKVVLYDTREGSSTHGELMEFLMGDNQPAQVLKVPPGVAHGCKAVGDTVNLFYVTSHVYDPADEGRIPHDDPAIGYDWTAGPTIE